jgi:Helix-turn-helix domain
MHKMQSEILSNGLEPELTQSNGHTPEEAGEYNLFIGAAWRGVIPDPFAWAVYSNLRSHANNKTRIACPSAETIHKETGVSPRKVKMVLAHLRKTGWIEHRGFEITRLGRSTRYFVPLKPASIKDSRGGRAPHALRQRPPRYPFLVLKDVTSTLPSLTCESEFLRLSACNDKSELLCPCAIARRYPRFRVPS